MASRLYTKRSDVDADDYNGYVVGLHYGERSKVASVSALDLNDLELNSEDDR